MLYPDLSSESSLLFTSLSQVSSLLLSFSISAPVNSSLPVSPTWQALVPVDESLALVPECLQVACAVAEGGVGRHQAPPGTGEVEGRRLT